MEINNPTNLSEMTFIHQSFPLSCNLSSSSCQDPSPNSYANVPRSSTPAVYTGSVFFPNHNDNLRKNSKILRKRRNTRSFKDAEKNRLKTVLPVCLQAAIPDSNRNSPPLLDPNIPDSFFSEDPEAVKASPNRISKFSGTKTVENADIEESKILENLPCTSLTDQGSDKLIGVESNLSKTETMDSRQQAIYQSENDQNAPTVEVLTINNENFEKPPQQDDQNVDTLNLSSSSDASSNPIAFEVSDEKTNSNDISTSDELSDGVSNSLSEESARFYEEELDRCIQKLYARESQDDISKQKSDLLEEMSEDDVWNLLMKSDSEKSDEESETTINEEYSNSSCVSIYDDYNVQQSEEISVPDKRNNQDDEQKHKIKKTSKVVEINDNRLINETQSSEERTRELLPPTRRSLSLNSEITSKPDSSGKLDQSITMVDTFESEIKRDDNLSDQISLNLPPDDKIDLFLDETNKFDDSVFNEQKKGQENTIHTLPVTRYTSNSTFLFKSNEKLPPLEEGQLKKIIIPNEFLSTNDFLTIDWDDKKDHNSDFLHTIITREKIQCEKKNETGRNAKSKISLPRGTSELLKSSELANNNVSKNNSLPIQYSQQQLNCWNAEEFEGLQRDDKVRDSNRYFVEPNHRKASLLGKKNRNNEQKHKDGLDFFTTNHVSPKCDKSTKVKIDDLSTIQQNTPCQPCKHSNHKATQEAQWRVERQPKNLNATREKNARGEQKSQKSNNEEGNFVSESQLHNQNTYSTNSCQSKKLVEITPLQSIIASNSRHRRSSYSESPHSNRAMKINGRKNSEQKHMYVHSRHGSRIRFKLEPEVFYVDDYDRRPRERSFNRTALEKFYIKEELNIYKKTEMQVHRDSRRNTRYHFA